MNPLVNRAFFRSVLTATPLFSFGQTEIDCLQLVRDSSPFYSFKFLVIFSVESVAVVDPDGKSLQEDALRPEEKPVVMLEASQLSTVHLGKFHRRPGRPLTRRSL